MKLEFFHLNQKLLRFSLTFAIALALIALGLFGVKVNPGNAQPYKVGLVTDVAGIADKSFNWMAYQGLLRAEQNLGVIGTLYEPARSDDYDPLLAQCVAEGNDMCIGVGFLLGGPVENAANLNPTVMFATVDYSYASYPSNLRGLIFASAEAAYLAGALSARMTAGQKLGVVAGMKIPPVDIFIDGYRQGALCTDLSLKTRVDYTNSFDNQQLGEQTAQEQLTWGADVMFAVAGGAGIGATKTTTAAQKWAIGVDSDFYSSVFDDGAVAGAEYVITSVMKHIDNAVYDTIDDLIDGTFTSGDELYNLANAGVGLAPFHEADPAVSQAVRDELAALEQDIISGVIDPQAPCPGQVQVGLVSDSASFNDLGFNAAAYQGLVRSQSENAVYIRTYESGSQIDYEHNLGQCMDDSNDLCFSVGFLMEDATYYAAIAHPSKQFAIVDVVYDPPLSNVRGMAFAIDQAAYLGGVLAASMPGVDKLGVIGGMQIPPVEFIINSFQQGAHCIDPNIPILLTYTDDFGNPDLGSQVAQGQIAQGADLIFPVAGPTGFGAVEAAAQAGVWGMGVDTDYYYTVFDGGSQPGAAYMLTSVMKLVENAVYETILDLIGGNFTGGTKLYDLASAGVGLAPFHEADPEVPTALRTYLDLLARDIAAGDLTPSECRHYSFIPLITK